MRNQINIKLSLIVAGVFLSATLNLLSGCEGTVTGTKADSIQLKIEANGGYAPLSLKLSADMSPISLNFRAEQAVDSSAIGKWNRYQATLKRGNKMIGSKEFSINYLGSADAQPAAPYQVQTMMIVRLDEGEGGEYELVINALGRAEVKLQGERVEIRRNITMVR